MRLDVYQQELTAEVVVVPATAKNSGASCYGVRIYLLSSPGLRDRSTVTIWVSERSRAERLASLLKTALGELEE